MRIRKDQLLPLLYYHNLSSPLDLDGSLSKRSPFVGFQKSKVLAVDQSDFKLEPWCGKCKTSERFVSMYRKQCYNKLYAFGLWGAHA